MPPSSSRKSSDPNPVSTLSTLEDFDVKTLTGYYGSIVKADPKHGPSILMDCQPQGPLLQFPSGSKVDFKLWSEHYNVGRYTRVVAYLDLLQRPVELFQVPVDDPFFPNPVRPAAPGDILATLLELSKDGGRIKLDKKEDGDTAVIRSGYAVAMIEQRIKTGHRLAVTLEADKKVMISCRRVS